MSHGDSSAEKGKTARKTIDNGMAAEAMSFSPDMTKTGCQTVQILNDRKTGVGNLVPRAPLSRGVFSWRRRTRRVGLSASISLLKKHSKRRDAGEYVHFQ